MCNINRKYLEWNNKLGSFKLCNSVTRPIIRSNTSSFGHKSPENRNLENDRRLATSAHGGEGGKQDRAANVIDLNYCYQTDYPIIGGLGHS